jgi:hypothetical protein
MNKHRALDCPAKTLVEYYECHPFMHGMNTLHGPCHACAYYGKIVCHCPKPDIIHIAKDHYGI